MQKDMELEKGYLNDTLELIELKLNNLHISSNHLEGIFNESNKEYFEYLKSNANKMNEEDVVELVNLQGRLDDLQEDSRDYVKMQSVYNKMLGKPYFASILSATIEQYFISMGVVP